MRQLYHAQIPRAVIAQQHTARSAARQFGSLHRTSLSTGWAVAGRVRSAFIFTIDRAQIAAIDLVMDPVRLRAFDIRIL